MIDEKKYWQTAQTTLKNVFRLTEFREGQEEIIRAVLSGRDTLAVMPTGSGKSLCYQLPGLILPGMTLVISPLIALMKDQVDSLLARDIPAANLNSMLNYAKQQEICERVYRGEIKFLFVAPERIRNSSFQSLLRSVPIGLLAVDEAHCISQWGHDFRPDYRRLGGLRKDLNMPVTIALTATASPEVQRDIVDQLSLRDPSLNILGFDRLNLRFGVEKMRTETEKLEYALEYVRQRIQNRMGFKRQYAGCGILYASTIKQAEAAGAYLKKHGIRAGIYHAGLPPAVRTRIQEQFMNDEFHCLIATTAFGMGVDKPDIRYVLHLSLSSSVEAYTQESGRAGRDRKPAECMLLYAGRDVKIQEFFIDNGCPDLPIYRTMADAFAEQTKTEDPQPGSRLSLEELLKNFEHRESSLVDTALRKLRALDFLDISPDDLIIWRKPLETGTIVQLAEESRIQKKALHRQLSSLVRYVFDDNCRTKFILKYFGSREGKSFKRCHHCDLCKAMPIRPEQGKPGTFPPEPLHWIILKYLSTIARCQNARLPVNNRQAAGILTGTTGEPAFSGISTFGTMAYMDAAEIPVLGGVIREAGLTEQNSLAYIQLTPDGKKCLAAKNITDFPPTLQNYLHLRFPHAPEKGNAWRQ